VVSDIATRGIAEFDPSTAPVACDGLLALDCGPFAETIARVRPAEDTPVVSLGTNVLPGTDAVRIDLAPAFRAATEHLIAQNCRRIVYASTATTIGRFANLSMTFVRPRDAYFEAMAEAGLAASFLPLENAARSTARQATLDYVREKGCPDAILCRNDDIAIGTYAAACQLGLEVGRDLLIVGCDGQESTEYFPCPLSTIVFPVAEMCRVAWEFMQARLDGKGGELQEVTLDARLEVRQSAIRQGAGGKG
jgi:LacI family transcriptional regulator